MMRTNYVLEHLLMDTIMRSRLIENTDELDTLIRETSEKLHATFHTQNSLLTEDEVSERFKFLSVIKLRNMRARNQGPTFIKFGKGRNGRVFYRIADIESWIVRHEQLEHLLER